MPVKNSAKDLKNSMRIPCFLHIVKGTSQNSCAFESPTFFIDELLNMTSLVEFVSKPRAHVPTTRQTPSGFRPPLICKIIEHDNQKKLIYHSLNSMCRTLTNRSFLYFQGSFQSHSC